jgi:ATP-dependent Clp protease ATP-binding subunit ClpA
MMTKKKDKHFFQVFEKIRYQLKKMIYDQDDAVDELVDALIHISCRPEEAQPRGIFTFLGPDSVGKTYLARSLAEFLEGTSYSSIWNSIASLKVSFSCLVEKVPWKVTGKEIFSGMFANIHGP